MIIKFLFIHSHPDDKITKLVQIIAKQMLKPKSIEYIYFIIQYGSYVAMQVHERSVKYILLFINPLSGGTGLVSVTVHPKWIPIS